jgi:hypothetical protein
MAQSYWKSEIADLRLLIENKRDATAFPHRGIHRAGALRLRLS